jgi:pyruvate/2-oxoglutarate/acetoin dehydrogenase E1 component
LGSFTVPLGRPEILRSGTDATVVSYGSTLRIVTDAATELERFGISIEVIDVQTLLPFDLDGACVASLKRTNRLLVVDEDVPGGAAAYLMQQILEEQGGYQHLDAAPRTLTAKAHRPAYGSDGDYFSKPSAEDVVEAVLELVAQ